MIPDDRKSYETVDPSRGIKLASTVQGNSDDVNQAVQAAKDAQKKWAALSGHARARYLYR